EQAIALYDPRQHSSLAFLYGGEDPGVTCRGFAAWTLWSLGYPDQALKRSYEALTLAQELLSFVKRKERYQGLGKPDLTQFSGVWIVPFFMRTSIASPLNLVWAFSVTAVLHQFRQEGQAAYKQIEATITLSIEQG